MDKFSIKTTDIFKAAYLFHFVECELSVGHQYGVGVVYTLVGENVKREEQKYLSGDVDVNLLCLKESFYAMLEKGGQTIKPI